MSDEQIPSGEQTPAAATALAGKRANWTIAHKIDAEAGTITWQVKGAGEIRLELGKVHEANSKRAMMHGFVQRISDAAAMARDGKTGASATAQQKFEAMSKLCEHYQSGAQEWSPVRTAGSAGSRVNPQAQLLIAALLIHSPGKGAEVVEKFVKGLTGAQLSALVLSELLKEAVELAREQLREKELKLSEGVNAEELLEGLAGL